MGAIFATLSSSGGPDEEPEKTRPAVRSVQTRDSHVQLRRSSHHGMRLPPVGILAVLAIVTLRQDAGADAAVMGGYAESLAAIKDWTFKLGPGFVVGIGNGLILGYLMLRSR